MRLTNEQFWNSRHETHNLSTKISVQARKGLFRQFLDNARRRQGAQVGQSYGNFAIQSLLRAHPPVRPDYSLIEIRCAQGNDLVNLHRTSGYEPYGIEYSHSGVISTLETSRRYGFNTVNVIETDCLDLESHNRFRGNCDVVFSAGFIEHFDLPDEVLNLHVNLLKTGGYLICIIPNLFGLFYPFLSFCARSAKGT